MSEHTQRKRAAILAEFVAEAQDTGQSANALIVAEMVRLLRALLSTAINGQDGGRPNRSDTYGRPASRDDF